MKYPYVIFLSLCSFLISNVTFSCQELKWTPSQRALNSNYVYIGRITSIAMPSLSEDSLFSVDNGYAPRGVDRIVRIKVYESLKGNNKDSIEVKLDWCTGGQARPGDRVVLYGINNQWHVISEEHAITESRSALTKMVPNSPDNKKNLDSTFEINFECYSALKKVEANLSNNFSKYSHYTCLIDESQSKLTINITSGKYSFGGLAYEFSTPKLEIISQVGYR